MRHKIILYILFLTIFTILQTSYAQGTLSLTETDAIETGLKNNKVLKSLSYKTVIAEAKYKESETFSLPSLKLQASYTRMSEIKPFVIPTPFGNFSLNPSQPDNYAVKLSVMQPLYTGNKISSGIDAARFMNLSAGFEYQMEVQNTKLQIQTAYWNLYKAGLMKNVLEEALLNITSRVKDAENLFSQGMLTKNDLLKIQVQQSDIKYRLFEVNDAQAIANTYLGTLLGLEKDMNIVPVTEINEIDSDSFNLDELVQYAYSERNDLKAHQLKIFAAKEQKVLAQSGWYPQLFLSGNYMYAKPNQRYFPPENKFQDAWDISVVLSYDLWNWLAPAYVTEQAVANVHLAEESFSAMKDAVRLEIIQHHLQIKLANEKYQVAKLGLEQAKENLLLTEAKFREGMSMSSDLIDAESFLIQAKVNYTNSIIDYKLSTARLMKAAGK
ncbi:MAG: membrane protein [Ignavibacteriales bacterium]